MRDVLLNVTSKQKRMAAIDQFSFLFQGINRNLKVCEEILAIIGLLYVSKTAFAFTWNFLQGLRTHIFSRFRRLNLTRYGKWAGMFCIFLFLKEKTLLFQNLWYDIIIRGFCKCSSEIYFRNLVHLSLVIVNVYAY